MRSPFPGMDPFIEAQGLWEDFHNKLMGDLERHLSTILPERYTVRLGERSYIDHLDPRQEGNVAVTMRPDVAIKSKEPRSAGGASLLEVSAIDMEGMIETEVRELYLEIHELDPQLRLVTGIEILSPTNKKPGSVGWYQYERKRRVFLEGHASLIEIDLVRGGRRHAMAQSWPSSPYYLLVLRKEQAPRCKVFAAGCREPLPTIPVPLAAPDADVPLSLQPLIDGVYQRSRYWRALDYTRPLRVPLTAADAEWWQTQPVGARRDQ